MISVFFYVKIMGATERVIQFIEYKGISKYKFCKDLGFSNKFLDNSSNMGTDKAGKILHYYPEINPEWLLTGNGDMLRDKSTVVSEPVATYRKTKDGIKEQQNIPLFNLEATMGLIPYENGNGLDNNK